MQINELRIGNYLGKRINSHNQHEHIKEKYLQVTGKFISDCCEYPTLLEHHPPIPLTEKLLKMTNLQKEILWNSFSFIDGMVKYYIDINKERFQNKYSCEVIATYGDIQLAIATVKYFHELQNLIHSLTGQELTIKE